jgi:hypothetical protein
MALGNGYPQVGGYPQSSPVGLTGGMVGAPGIPVSTAPTVDALADLLEAAPITDPVSLARIQDSLLGYPYTMPPRTAAVALREALQSSMPIGMQPYGNSMVQGRSMWQFLTGASKGKLGIVRNSGVSGYMSSQVLAKLQAEGFQPGVSMMPYQEGTNDSAQSVTTAAHIANMQDIAITALKAGKLPLLALCPPADVSAWQATTHAKWLAEIVMAEALGIAYIDPYARWVDTDGTWTAGASTDQTHPINDVYIAAAQDAWASLSLNTPTYLLPRLNTGQGMIGGNVLGLTDTNADNLPDGWTALSLTGQTYAARTDYAFPFRGKRTNVSVSQSGTGYFFRQNNSGYAVGNKMRVTGVIGVQAISNASVTVFVRGGAMDDLVLFTSGSATSDQYVSADFTVAAGATSLSIYIMFQSLNGGAYTATIGFGCLDIYNLTANTF